jgi:hypothetical protein
MYLRSTCYSRAPNSYILSNGNWSIGQFDPADLKRIRMLALAEVWPGHEPLVQISSALRLCTGVTELFLVPTYLDSTSGASTPNCDQLNGNREEEDREGEFWGWVECDEAYVCGDFSPLREWWLEQRFEQYKKELGGEGIGFFKYSSRKFEEELRAGRDKVVRDGRTTPWEIPSVKFVIVGTTRMVRKLLEMRDRYWRAFGETEQKEQEREDSPLSLAWQDDLEAYGETHLAPA